MSLIASHFGAGYGNLLSFILIIFEDHLAEFLHCCLLGSRRLFVGYGVKLLIAPTKNSIRSLYASMLFTHAFHYEYVRRICTDEEMHFSQLSDIDCNISHHNEQAGCRNKPIGHN